MVRALDESDLMLLQTERGIQAPAITRLRHRHYALARALASGMKDWEAALSCGYDPSRVSVLKADPMFQNLVRFYKETVDEKYADLHERLSGLSVDAAAELQQRLEDAPEDISVGQLLEIMKSGADRTGHGPQSQSTQLNIHVDLANRMQAARKRVNEQKLIDVTPETKP